MYEKYTHQSLPQKEYRELLGTAIYVFNSNNAFIIENILKNDENEKFTWYKLIDLTSGTLKPIIKKTILKEAVKQKKKKLGNEIIDLFQKLVDTRNRIIHSFSITDSSGDQILATKDKKNEQFKISKKLLMTFIEDNDELSSLLHEFRGY
ncbi:selenium binding protein [Lactococcus garvieae]|uniref:selenium binding protein n=1 Tax=Lactococcus garvieae TaxID=1363 RepID=UPI00254AC4B2|nr:selenium binding protein [Lactococcus garvieae]